MNPRVSTWFLILGFFVSCILLSKNLVFGASYALAFFPLVIFIVLVRKWGAEVWVPVFIAVFSIYAFYFIRPIFLGFYPDFFGYKSTNIPSTFEYAIAMLGVGSFSVAFLIGLYAMLISGRSSKERKFSLLQPGVIFRLRYLFLFFLLILVFLWAGLVLFFDVGVKKATSNLEVLKFILPISLIVPSAIGYLCVNQCRTVSVFEKLLITLIVGSMFFLIVIGGSKLGSFLLLLYGLILILFIKEDFRITPFHTSMLVVGSSIFIVISVITANIIKFRSFGGFANFSEFVVFTLDRITFRLTGYDGFLVTLMERPLGMEHVVQWKNIAASALSKLVPGYGGDEISVGKAVAVYYGEKDFDIQYSGALGLFGMLNFMHGLAGGVLMAVVIGAFFGGCFRIAMTLFVGSVEKVIVVLVLCYQMAHWLSSGNFDSMFQGFFITVCHLCFYYICLRIFLGVVSQKQHEKLF